MSKRRIVEAAGGILYRTRAGAPDGDILVEVSPGWHYVNSDNNARSQVRESHIHFPIIFWGQNISGEKANRPVTVDYIAPTLSKAMRIRAPNACGLEPLF